ncbi:MAG: VWA domain-containing protein [Candidatus Aminicenantes bacterium]|nr:MAG: VWA domain-containing protein [Candidatus Aminicenantes bacterium]
MKNKIFFLILFLALALQPNLHELKPESTQTQKSQKAFQYEVTVVLKLVQVFVTDKEGKPVTDLNKDDFILYDNGKLQKITDFEKHLLVKPKKPVPPEKKVEEVIEETQLPPAREVQTRMNRKFILLLDIDRNSVRGVTKSKNAALHFIDSQVQPDDEVGVFSYSHMTGLVVHEYLTTDHEKVKDAIKRIKGVPGLEGGFSMDEGIPRFESQAESSLTQQFVRSGSPTDIMEKTTNFINNLKDLAKVLRYIPGYKNIIFFSGGIPSSVLFSPDQTIRENYEDMSKELATASSPVYTVNTLGPEYDQSLGMLSNISGGKYMHIVDYYDQVATQIQNVTSNYYVLGYYIDETWDGKFHEIKVQVKRKGYEVQAQSGYFNPKPFVELSEFEKEVHLIELALSENPYLQDPYRLNNIALPCSEKKDANCVLLSEIPLAEIEEIISGQTEHTNFILDDENNVIFSSKGEIDFSPFSQKKIYSYSILSLPPGEYDCRTIIRNLQTGKVAVASSSVKIPELFKTGIKLDPPLLLIPEKESTYLRLIKGPKKDPLSINDIYPLLSNQHSPLIDEIDRNVSKLLAVVRCSVADIQKPEVNITAHLFEKESGNKTELPFSILNSERKEKTDVLLLEIHLPELKPGDYAIEMIAEEKNSKQRSQTKTSFIVK